MVYVALFPDAAERIADAIQVRHRASFGSQLATTNRTPSPRPSEFVKVIGVGGVRRDQVTDVPTLAVEAWASTRSRAAALAQEVRAVMASLEGATFAGYTVQAVTEYAGPGDLPDPLSDQSRYTATYAIAIRSEQSVNINL
jgi:hypothetical protein